MKIVTSWMEKGIEQGIEQGKRALVRRLLHKRVGMLEPQMEGRIDAISDEQLEQLAEALLDFTTPSDLAAWLDAHVAQ